MNGSDPSRVSWARGRLTRVGREARSREPAVVVARETPGATACLLRGPGDQSRASPACATREGHRSAESAAWPPAWRRHSRRLWGDGPVRPFRASRPRPLDACGESRPGAPCRGPEIPSGAGPGSSGRGPRGSWAERSEPLRGSRSRVPDTHGLSAGGRSGRGGSRRRRGFRGPAPGEGWRGLRRSPLANGRAASTVPTRRDERRRASLTRPALTRSSLPPPRAAPRGGRRLGV